MKNMTNKITNALKSYIDAIDAPWYALPVFLILALSMYFVMTHITLSPYESVKPTILWRVDRPPKIGDYVTFPFQHDLIKTDLKHWVKYLACMEGHSLTRVEDDVFLCDGKEIAKVRLYSKAKELLPQFTFSGVIPKNKAFVFGDGEDSFDSRHFGFVDLDIMTTNLVIL